MSRIDDLIAEFCPDGVGLKMIGSVCEVFNGYAFKSELFNTDGDGIPLIRIRDVNTGFSETFYSGVFDDRYFVEDGDLLIGMDGDFRATKWKHGKALLNQRVCRLQDFKPDMLAGFMYYIVQGELNRIQNSTQGSTVKHLSSRELECSRVPVPPIEVQREVVKILDAFTELEAELEAELEVRQKQYQHYLDRLLVLAEAPRMVVGDLFDFKNGLNKGKEFFGKGTPIVNFVDVFKHRALTKQMVNGRVEVTPKEQDLYSAKMNDVFFTRTSETRDEIGMTSVLLADIEDCVFSGFVLRARPKTELLLPKFCAYIFSSPDVRKEIVRNSSFTTRALTNGGVLSRLVIPVPTLGEQAHIVEILDKLNALVNDISSGLPAEIAARRQQYAYYRDKLLSFKEAA